MLPEWDTNPIVVGRASCESSILLFGTEDSVPNFVVVFLLFDLVDNSIACSGAHDKF
jgi:hypothetical protein